MGSIVSVLTQVTFRFDTATDIRYLARPPRQGDHVRTVDGRLWVVTDVAKDEGGFLVICVPLGGDDPASL
jgi:hypothetical protein